MASQDSHRFVQQLYVAYYGRPADSDGLAYWTERTETEGQKAIVDAFGSSEEFQNDYGELSDEALVTTLYQQAFSRDPEEDGLAYYTGALESSEKSLAQIAYAITSAAVDADERVLDAKIAAAMDYTDSLPGPHYVIPQAQRLLASIDATDTQDDLGQARQAIDQSVIALAHQEVLDRQFALEYAEDELSGKEFDREEKAIELGVFSRDNPDGSFIDDAQVKLDAANAALADAQTDTADAALEASLDEAREAVQESTDARELLDERDAAQAALEANVADEGSSRELAYSLSNAASRYLANAPDIDDRALNTVYKLARDYYFDNSENLTEADLLDAVAVADDAIFAGDDGESVLEQGSLGDRVEKLATTLNQRNDLFNARDQADVELGDTPEGEALLDAEQALAGREALKMEVGEAEEVLDAITSFENGRDEALARFNAADAAFDYQVKAIDSPEGNDGVDDSTPVLFEYDVRVDESADEAVTDAEIVNFGKDDLLSLDKGFASYRLAEVMDADGDADGDGSAEALKGNDKAFDVFFRQSENGEDAEVLVENARYPAGSETGEIYTITLVGVDAQELVFGGDAISYGGIA